MGAHALGVNPHSIGIGVDGNFETKPPTAAQMNSLVKLVLELMEKYHIPLDRVVPHRDVTEGTSCPGKLFPWDELMQRLYKGEFHSAAAGRHRGIKQVGKQRQNSGIMPDQEET
ncbi:hypothetical protein P22_1626 [Propionispora sp. 2/2-37]|nr:hypothetical protein P22_1626 [Propionispora sp. 2/2-37]